MARIIRDPQKAASDQYDLIIIGGGIYGAMLALESSLRGLSPLLLERDDFGQHTSFNSLRIIHGGLRYLQSFDLHRFRESVKERKWFLKTFPHLVKPLPCLMPLYGVGLHRPFILRSAMLVNDILSYNRNRGLPEDLHMPSGRIFDTFKTKAIFPSVNGEGLKGSAVWHDAYMPDSQRLLIEVLRWACELGATVLNYIEVRDLIKKGEVVTGITAFDRESGKTYKYKSNTVVNSAGPWSREIAARFHKDLPELFRPSIAWNILFNRTPLSTYALAVTPKLKSGRTYFLVPWKGKMLAGTGHAFWLKIDMKEPKPTNDQILWFLNDLNLAVPKLNLKLNDILHIFSGLLPVKRNGTDNLTKRAVIFNHASQGGPRGLYSISGIKFTTSRLVAEKTLNLIYPQKKLFADALYQNVLFPSYSKRKRRYVSFEKITNPHRPGWVYDLERFIKDESVLHLDDLIFRRTSLWEDQSKAIEWTPQICDLFTWDKSRQIEEINRLNHSFKTSKMISEKDSS
jgi:glycerol-3-phosphate dehydrogenase